MPVAEVRAMDEGERARFDPALLRVRASAYPPGEFVGQEGFARASEVLELARRAGVGPGVGVLDLCCGAGGPGRLVTRELGCAYLGVDASAAAVALARERADGLDCRYLLARVPPVPSGRWDVVLLLETVLAFPDKPALLAGVADALVPGGRFAFTVEAGEPLTAAERAVMPDADTVWLTPWPELVRALQQAGLQVRWQDDVTAAHGAVVDALLAAFARSAPEIDDELGPGAIDELVAGHRLWSTWLRQGRVRKLAAVAERAD
jgi:sarcosine/dimethylglycine N-methyltransferase